MPRDDTLFLCVPVGSHHPERIEVVCESSASRACEAYAARWGEPCRWPLSLKDYKDILHAAQNPEVWPGVMIRIMDEREGRTHPAFVVMDQKGDIILIHANSEKMARYLFWHYRPDDTMTFLASEDEMILLVNSIEEISP